MTDMKTTIELAREAGAFEAHAFLDEPLALLGTDKIERFAALIREQEREACAALVQANADACDAGSTLAIYLASNAAAIRARKEQHYE